MGSRGDGHEDELARLRTNKVRNRTMLLFLMQTHCTAIVLHTQSLAANLSLLLMLYLHELHTHGLAMQSVRPSFSIPTLKLRMCLSTVISIQMIVHWTNHITSVYVMQNSSKIYGVQLEIVVSQDQARTPAFHCSASTGKCDLVSEWNNNGARH